MPIKLGTVYSSKHKKVKSGTPSVSNSELEKLNELEKSARKIIFEAESVAPWGFFKGKDKITICTNRIAITRQTWSSNEERPIAIENIVAASVYRHMRYASLSIDTFGIPKPEPITRMRIKDARLARRYMLALVECKKAGIDLTKIDLPELRERLKNLGAVRFTGDEGYHKI